MGISEKLRLMTVFGTRPEVIKMAPVILEANHRQDVEMYVCSTGQHRQMLDQMVKIFSLKLDSDLDIMQPNQGLQDITAKVIVEVTKEYHRVKPDIVLVQGDTTTVFAAALAAFYEKIPVAHIEAGLRTDNPYNPFPEEMNRRLASQLATYNFAPTVIAQQNLLRDGVPARSITVTGNTVVDALKIVTAQSVPFKDKALFSIDFDSKKVVLITTHRRENVGEGMESIYRSIRRLAEEFQDHSFVFPVHLNPKVRDMAHDMLGGVANIHLVEPMEYTDLIGVMQKSRLILTDSGGIQEEAPAFGVPVLVLRTTTERPEGVTAGVSELVGANEEKIYSRAKQLLTNEDEHQKMAQASNPYGDGTAAKQIIDKLIESHAHQNQ